MVKVAQCWDDGVLNDLRLVELLRKYNAKATFNLNPALHEKSRRKVDGTYKFKGIYDAGKLSLDELTDVYEGFQVASHTMMNSWRTRLTPVNIWKTDSSGNAAVSHGPADAIPPKP